MKWDISGLSISFDITDAVNAERYEKAYKNLSDAKNSISNSGIISDYIRSFCDIIKSFFSDLFDSETADLIFYDTPVSINAYAEVYAGFISFIEKQFAETRKRAETLHKYIPNAESSV